MGMAKAHNGRITSLLHQWLNLCVKRRSKLCGRRHWVTTRDGLGFLFVARMCSLQLAKTFRRLPVACVAAVG